MKASLSNPILSRRPFARVRPRPATSSEIPDPAVLRVRRAGGPVDEACYSCECGCVFLASVSTTVECPHCAARQPW